MQGIVKRQAAKPISWGGVSPIATQSLSSSQPTQPQASAPSSLSSSGPIIDDNLLIAGSGYGANRGRYAPPDSPGVDDAPVRVPKEAPSKPTWGWRGPRSPDSTGKPSSDTAGSPRSPLSLSQTQTQTQTQTTTRRQEPTQQPRTASRPAAMRPAEADNGSDLGGGTVSDDDEEFSVQYAEPIDENEEAEEHEEEEVKQPPQQGVQGKKQAPTSPPQSPPQSLPSSRPVVPALQQLTHAQPDRTLPSQAARPQSPQRPASPLEPASSSNLMNTRALTESQQLERRLDQFGQRLQQFARNPATSLSTTSSSAPLGKPSTVSPPPQKQQQQQRPNSPQPPQSPQSPSSSMANRSRPVPRSPPAQSLKLQWNSSGSSPATKQPPATPLRLQWGSDGDGGARNDDGNAEGVDGDDGTLYPAGDAGDGGNADGQAGDMSLEQQSSLKLQWTSGSEQSRVNEEEAAEQPESRPPPTLQWIARNLTDAEPDRATDIQNPSHVPHALPSTTEKDDDDEDDEDESYLATLINRRPQSNSSHSYSSPYTLQTHTQRQQHSGDSDDELTAATRALQGSSLSHLLQAGRHLSSRLPIVPVSLSPTAKQQEPPQYRPSSPLLQQNTTALGHTHSPVHGYPSLENTRFQFNAGVLHGRVGARVQLPTTPVNNVSTTQSPKRAHSPPIEQRAALEEDATISFDQPLQPRGHSSALSPPPAAALNAADEEAIEAADDAPVDDVLRYTPTMAQIIGSPRVAATVYAAVPPAPASSTSTSNEPHEAPYNQRPQTPVEPERILRRSTEATVLNQRVAAVAQLPARHSPPLSPRIEAAGVLKIQSDSPRTLHASYRPASPLLPINTHDQSSQPHQPSSTHTHTQPLGRDSETVLRWTDHIEVESPRVPVQVTESASYQQHTQRPSSPSTAAHYTRSQQPSSAWPPALPPSFAATLPSSLAGFTEWAQFTSAVDEWHHATQRVRTLVEHSRALRATHNSNLLFGNSPP